MSPSQVPFAEIHARFDVKTMADHRFRRLLAKSQHHPTTPDPTHISKDHLVPCSTHPVVTALHGPAHHCDPYFRIERVVQFVGELQVVRVTGRFQRRPCGLQSKVWSEETARAAYRINCSGQSAVLIDVCPAPASTSLSCPPSTPLFAAVCVFGVCARPGSTSIAMVALP